MSLYVRVGKLVASFGFQGHLILKHSLGKKTALKGLEHIFIEEVKDSFIPYFIEQSSSRNEDEVLLKLEGIDTKEKTTEVLQREAWLKEEDFKKYSAKSAPISFLGFKLQEGDNILGEVFEVIEQPHQVLCKITYKGNEALIPLHEETLVDIDKRKKIIHVSLPDGLLDLYSGE